MEETEFIKQIEQSLLTCYATKADPSSYNRFHINRIKDIIEGRKGYYNENETERRWDYSQYTYAEKLAEIASEFYNMHWTSSFCDDDLDEKKKFFKSEITSYKKAYLWCEIAEVQLVPKGLMTP